MRNELLRYKVRKERYSTCGTSSCKVPEVMSEFGPTSDSSLLISVDVVNFSGNSLGLRADCSLTPNLEPTRTKQPLQPLSIIVIHIQGFGL